MLLKARPRAGVRSSGIEDPSDRPLEGTGEQAHPVTAVTRQTQRAERPVPDGKGTGREAATYAQIGGYALSSGWITSTTERHRQAVARTPTRRLRIHSSGRQLAVAEGVDQLLCTGWVCSHSSSRIRAVRRVGALRSLGGLVDGERWPPSVGQRRRALVRRHGYRRCCCRRAGYPDTAYGCGSWC